MFNLCAPALIYVAFSLTQVIIDTFQGLYNTAFIKIIVMIIITILLNALCQLGMSIISWIIVFIPFIFMSLIVAILLYIFELDPATGKLNINTNNSQQQGGNLVFSSSQINNSRYMDVSYSEEPVAPYNNSSDPQYE